MRTLAILMLLLQMPLAQANMFGDNKVDDSFAVKSVEGAEAVLSGKPKDLKVGDMLYINRSPFQFKVTAITGDKVTVALPERHDLKVGNALLRRASDQIKKSIDTENRLKKALED